MRDHPVQTISFYSYKGGVGRSLALTNLGVYLARFGATVVMVDFDLEAPGLNYKLMPGEVVEVAGRGLAGLLADISNGVPVDEADYELAVDVSEYAVAEDFGSDEGVEDEQPRGQLLLVPAGNPLQSEYWRDLAAIDWEQLFATGNRPGVGALALLKQHLEDRFDPEVLLVDSRTGITPGGGISTTLLPDVVVTLLLNSPEHLDGSRTVVGAVTQSGEAPPKVIPVLSRYMSPVSRARVATRTRLSRIDHDGLDETELEGPLQKIHATLTEGLPSVAAERVAQPLVLHSDAALQRQESLAFGRYAGAVDRGPNLLLEDYLRLFSALVPREMILRYTNAVRRRARAALLDRPDDAVGTLEGLLTLVGDAKVFEDLIKIYALRRDLGSMLLAADRLFRVHDLIVIHPILTNALRDITVRPQRSAVLRGVQLSPRFLESYWRQAAPEDAEWGSSIALEFAQVDAIADARRLVTEIIDRDPSTKARTHLIRAISRGNEEAERLALELVANTFETGAESMEFLQAASQAVQYRPDRGLAERILQAPGANSLPDGTVIRLMVTAGRVDDASELLVDILAGMRPGDSDLEELAAVWEEIASRNRAVRLDLAGRNPGIAEYMDSLREE